MFTNYWIADEIILNAFQSVSLKALCLLFLDATAILHSFVQSRF